MSGKDSLGSLRIMVQGSNSSRGTRAAESNRHQFHGFKSSVSFWGLGRAGWRDDCHREVFKKNLTTSACKPTKMLNHFAGLSFHEGPRCRFPIRLCHWLHFQHLKYEKSQGLVKGLPCVSVIAVYFEGGKNHLLFPVARRIVMRSYFEKLGVKGKVRFAIY